MKQIPIHCLIYSFISKNRSIKSFEKSENRMKIDHLQNKNVRFILHVLFLSTEILTLPKYLIWVS